MPPPPPIDIDPAWPHALERRFVEWCKAKREMDPTYAAAVGQHVHWLLRRLRAAGLAATVGAVAQEGEGMHSQSLLLAHDGPSLHAFFLAHRLFPYSLASSSAAAIRAADKAPGAQAVRSLIAVGEGGWMRRQRNYLLLLRFAAGAAVTAAEAAAEVGSDDDTVLDDDYDEEEGVEMQGPEEAEEGEEAGMDVSDDEDEDEDEEEEERGPPPPPTPPRRRIVHLTWAR